MTRRALCIGINRFRDRDAPPLNGCVNDAQNIAALLHGSFGFGSGDIRVLLDQQATKAKKLHRLLLIQLQQARFEARHWKRR